MSLNLSIDSQHMSQWIGDYVLFEDHQPIEIHEQMRKNLESFCVAIVNPMKSESNSARSQEDNWKQLIFKRIIVNETVVLSCSLILRETAAKKNQ